MKLTRRTHDPATWSGMSGHIHWHRQKWRQTDERWMFAQLPCVSSPAGSLAPSQSPTAAGRPTLRRTRSPWKECVLKRAKSDDSLGDAVDGEAAHDVAQSGKGSLQKGVHLTQLRKISSMSLYSTNLIGPARLQSSHLIFPLTQKTSQALYVANQLSDPCLVVPRKQFRSKNNFWSNLELSSSRRPGRLY